MKKLITLLLAMAGMVGTVSATTIYVRNNCNWGALYLYLYNSDTDNNTWPGVALSSTTEIGGVTYYKAEISTYANFIIHNNVTGNSNETFNERAQYATSNITDETYYQFNYSDEGWSGTDHVKWYDLVSDGTLHTYNFTTTTVGDYGTLKIYLFKDSNPINGGWDDTDMNKNGNVHTYTFKYVAASDGIGVVFHNGPYGQTDDMGAAEGDNIYILKYNESASNKLRRVEAATVNGSGYSTYVNTYPVAISGAKAYGAEDGGNGSATAHEITGNVPAGTPMLIMGTDDETYYFEVVGSGTALGYTNAFKAGDGSTITGGNGPFNYVLNGDAFYLAKSTGTTVASGKAYLQLSKQAGAGARVLRFADDEVQGINAISNFKAADGAYYNLSGQRVNVPVKGLYIQNGKKIIVK